MEEVLHDQRGMLYTAKGTAALLVPLSSWISQRSGWSAVFMVAAILNFAAARSPSWSSSPRAPGR